MPRAKENLIGNIVQIGHYVCVRYQHHGQRKTINCKGSLELARVVQRELTNLQVRGELEKVGDWILAPKTLVEKHKVIAITPEAFMEQYLTDLAARKRRNTHDSEDAVRRSQSFKNDKRTLDKFWSYVRVSKVCDLTRQTLSQYKTRRIQDGVDNATINRELATLCRMLRTVKELAYHDEDLGKQVDKLQVAKSGEPVVVVDSVDTIRAGFQACQRLCPDFLPLLWAFFKMGVRPSDALPFKKSYVLDHAQQVRFFSSKGNKWVTLQVDHDFHTLLVALKQDPANATDYLFVDKQGAKWTVPKLRIRMDTLRKAIGKSNDQYSPVVFRHTYGSLITKMQGIAVAQRFLGHSDIHVTNEHYTNVLLPYGEVGAKALPYQIPEIHAGYHDGVFAVFKKFVGKIVTATPYSRHSNNV